MRSADPLPAVAGAAARPPHAHRHWPVAAAAERPSCACVPLRSYGSSSGSTKGAILVVFLWMVGFIGVMVAGKCTVTRVPAYFMAALYALYMLYQATPPPHTHTRHHTHTHTHTHSLTLSHTHTHAHVHTPPVAQPTTEHAPSC
eukprot:7125892-Prymnesium_polylepis.2